MSGRTAASRACGNQLVRTRQSYVSAGFAVLLPDRGADLGTAVQTMAAIARPVTMVGTSRGTQRAAVALPRRAVLSEAGANRVFVVANGRVSERVVTVLDRTPTEVLIERGVAVGERVAAERIDQLGDGVAVQE